MNESAKIIDENTVMGINRKSFDAAMMILCDLCKYCQGERYRLTVDVSDDGVFIKKITNP